MTESNSYSESWASLTSLLKNDVWTVEDNNNDNHTWDDLGTGMPTYDGANATVTADDWLVSPPLTLTAGTRSRRVPSVVPSTALPSAWL